MSKVFNMVGGGGGKNISSIIITGLESTDTITCTKDGKSYTATWDSTAQHWEIVGLPFGTFTVTATNGTKTTTETVLIDIAGVYEVEMSYNLWLYREGDEFEEVTGGWTAKSAGNASFTKDGTRLIAYGGSNSTSYGKFYTVNKVDVTGWNKLKVTIDSATVHGDGVSSFFGLSETTDISADFGYNVLIANVYIGVAGEYEVDISEKSGSYYICFGSGNANRRATATNIWLE